ncbi:MAG: cupin domain-containing protein [Bacillota bacterium]|nr:cupin domain-containing protein [Bacillota bacterium]
MEIIVRKPTDAEKADMQKKSIWTCGVSKFDWYYDSCEKCFILEGEVTVEFEGGSVSFSSGDYVIFPKGLSCVWNVKKPVKKHYVFE